MEVVGGMGENHEREVKEVGEENSKLRKHCGYLEEVVRGMGEDNRRMAERVGELVAAAETVEKVRVQN